MKLNIKIVVAFVVVLITSLSCNKEEKDKKQSQSQTFIAGTATIYTDNTIHPIVEDVLAVFHNVYDRARITQISRNDGEIVNNLLKDSTRVAVMARLLTKEEESQFIRKKIIPRITEFGTDAIALITNRESQDTVINLQDVYNILQGKESGNIKSLVFDNPKSSIVGYMSSKAGITRLPQQGVYALQSNEEVINYVLSNKNAIGVIASDWILQTPPALQQKVNSIKVLGVNNPDLDKGQPKYYKPNQHNLATGQYPLARKLYVLNYQGKQGLGMGFASFIGGAEGQRIILKSGLLPADIPPREIATRNQLQTTN